MTIKELLRLAQAENDAGHGDMEVKVWLPGSTIRLEYSDTMFSRRTGCSDNVRLIEGNLDPGSALE